MGRNIKRVLLGFDWPINKTWIGYLNPYRPIDCPYCEGSELSKEARELEDKWYDLDGDRENSWHFNLDGEDVKALLKYDRLMDLTHEFKDGKWVKNKDKVITPEMVNEWARKGIGYDGINRWICVEEKCKRLKIKYNCEHCKGQGYLFANKKVEKLHNNWEDYDPPKGKGYQLWEDTSEGSPKSPVFKTPEELAEWCENNTTVHGATKQSKEQWLSMINEGHIYLQQGNMIFL